MKLSAKLKDEEDQSDLENKQRDDVNVAEICVFQENFLFILKDEFLCCQQGRQTCLQMKLEK